MSLLLVDLYLLTTYDIFVTIKSWTIFNFQRIQPFCRYLILLIASCMSRKDKGHDLLLSTIKKRMYSLLHILKSSWRSSFVQKLEGKSIKRYSSKMASKFTFKTGVCIKHRAATYVYFFLCNWTCKLCKWTASSLFCLITVTVTCAQQMLIF